MAEVLNERTARVALKEKKFEVRNPASDHEIVTTEYFVIAKVDKTIEKENIKQKISVHAKNFTHS